MAQLTDQLIAIISKASNQRQLSELEAHIPWLRKRVALFTDINDHELLDVVKFCQYVTCSADDVIVRQGEQGDRMYVLLRGSASVYIDPAMTGEESTTLVSGLQLQEEIKPGGLDRSIYGRFIMEYGVGESFGEAVLLGEDKIRNASVIANDDCQMMVVDQLLFDKALKSHEQQIQNEILNFLDCQPFFGRMSSKFKRLLQLSLKKVTFPANVAICKQGNLVTSLYFVTKGEISIWTVPSYHQRQYPYLGLTNAGAYLLRHKSNDHQVGSTSLSTDLSTQSNVHSLRRKDATPSSEKDKRINLCSVQSGEVVGDIEIAHRLDTYMSTVICTSETTAFKLDVKNLERIVGRRNPYVMEVLKQRVQEKLELRAGTHVGKDVPLLHYLMSHKAEDRLSSARTLSPIHVSKELPSRDVQIQHLLNKFMKGQAELIEPMVPGALIYKEQMQDRARIRANIRRRTTTRSMLVEAKRKIHHRQPRSRRAIMATLTFMSDKNADSNSQTVTHLKSHKPPDIDADDTSSERSAERDNIPKVTIPINKSKDGAETQEGENRLGKQVTFHLPELHPLDQTTDSRTKLRGQSLDVSSNQRTTLQDNKHRLADVDMAPEVVHGGQAKSADVYHKKEVPATSASPTRLPPLAKPELRKRPVQLEQRATDVSTGQPDLSMDDRVANRSQGDTTEITDYQTSDTDLDDLENRMKTFLVLHCQGQSKMEIKLPRLRRYSDVIETTRMTPALRPGGKVWIKRMTCPFSTSSMKVTNHQHIRHHMIPHVTDKNDSLQQEIDFRLHH
ncbi:cAMP-dependent protein kinase regulatory subunit [Biomphalaria glabrata]|nr:cAMP-dependent protein kinase regulatory subunit [Biomphalaria glabrata]